MSNLVANLSTDDFMLSQSSKGGKILCTEIPGISFVLFHADRCHNCENVIPYFKQMSRSELLTGCKFALCNLARNPALIKMSSQTVAPFEYVPYMMLYYDGRPIARYETDDDEDFNPQDCLEFLQEMIKRLQSKKHFIQNKNFKFDDDVKKFGGIPFNLVCDEDKGVCYFEADALYGKNRRQ
jgi:hypothetical protein